jgi:PAS domain S-box-containing protein
MPGDPSEVAVLCVDDDQSLLDVSSYMLEAADDRLDVNTLGDPTAVLDHIREGEYDCLVCDYDMPNTNGLEVLDTVRAEFPAFPFILYTGKGSEEIASEAISAGVTDYLQKGSGQDHYELLANRIIEYVTRYRAEREYELTEQRYRRLVEQSVVGIGLSQDRQFQYTNSRFAEMFGYTPDEMVGMDIRAVIDESDHDRLEDAIAVREDGDVDSVHYVLTGKDRHGARFDIEVSGSRVIYQGAPAVLGVVQPLDTRRKALAELSGDALADLTTDLEFARDALGDEPADSDITVARRAVETALETVEAKSGQQTTPEGRVDIGEQFRTAWSNAAPKAATLTVESSREVNAPGATVEQFFVELLTGLADLDESPTVTLAATDSGFDVTVKVDADGPADVEVPQPPILSRLAELLQWDIYIAEPDDGVIGYSFHNVESGTDVDE